MRFGQLLSSSAEEAPTEYVHTANVSMSVCACGCVCLRVRNDDGGIEQKKNTVWLCGKQDIFRFFSICLSIGYYYPILQFFFNIYVCVFCVYACVSVVCTHVSVLLLQVGGFRGLVYLYEH